MMPEKIWAERHPHLICDPAFKGYWSEFSCLESQTMFVRADLYDTVTAERDTAKEIIKELVEALELYQKYNNIGNDLKAEQYDKAEPALARAKEILK